MTDRKSFARHDSQDEDPRRARASAMREALAEAGVDPIARRDFLTRMGAAIALAGLAGCTRAPREEIVPYVRQPPEVRPGMPRHYATASVLDGYATGILVESHTGRPTKIEGNPKHPASLGAAGAFEQASVLSLYDPSRARGSSARGVATTWDEVASAVSRGDWAKKEGRGLWLLLEPTSSPTAIALIEKIRGRLPQATIAFESTGVESMWEGAHLAFGRVLEPRLALEQADVVVALDADFLTAGPAALRHARHFAERRVPDGGKKMNRLYVVEPLTTVTGANADHRLAVRAADVKAVAAALAVAVGVPIASDALARLRAPAERFRAWIDAVARDLRANRGRSLVVAGTAQPPEVHALAHALNAALDNIGRTITFGESPIFEAGEASHGRGHLLSALAKEEVDTLVIGARNPVHTSAQADFSKLLLSAKRSLYLAAHDDETSALTSFTVARAHSLESWGDARAFDGTLSIIQPLIDPLFAGRTEIELLSFFAEGSARSSHDLVHERFGKGSEGAKAGDDGWRKALKSGVVADSAFVAQAVALDAPRLTAALARLSAASLASDRLELVSRLDPHVYDGRFADNAWLLELPAPVSKLTWTNAATLSAATAARLGIESGDELTLRTDGGASVTAPACIVAGQADDTVGLSLGWGRTHGPEIARGRGANAFALGASMAAASMAVTLGKTGKRRDLPITQTQRHLEGRDVDILRHGTLAEYRASSTNGRASSNKNALGPRPSAKRKLSLYDHEPGPSPWQWGMTIDLSRCTGCSACMVACQAENNVPTVGANNVILSREMAWIRIDSYIAESAGELAISPQPMLCQHCEEAPCEYVCPVNATVHSPDGLNEMVYNRCVGTRFCSNNCPYKVRRFNWFDFHRAESATEQLVHNPDVTVRERGVMEKCTFCVQRLREWEIKKQQGKTSPAPQTACQQTCPTQAIVFGDLRDASSEVAHSRSSDRIYAALETLGTEPRVRYLARIKNPNPEMA